MSIEKNETFETVLKLKSLDQVVGFRKVSLLKIDCEGRTHFSSNIKAEDLSLILYITGCEWEALKGLVRH